MHGINITLIVPQQAKSSIQYKNTKLKLLKTNAEVWFNKRREWRKLHIEELNDLYSVPSIVRVIKSRRIRWAGQVGRMEKEQGVHRVLVGKPEEKRPMGRPRRSWKDNIKMDLQEVGGGCGDWMELAQDSDRWREIVSTVKNLRFH
jgi:hypothetical protein